jgi:hypothetical protein
VLFTSAHVEGSRWATQVAPGLGGPYHQRMFSARLDMTVDGIDNAVDEVELERLPAGPDNPHGNAFTRRVTRLVRESDAVRTADASVGRSWQVVNPARTNRLGQPPAAERWPPRRALWRALSLRPWPPSPLLAMVWARAGQLPDPARRRPGLHRGLGGDALATRQRPPAWLQAGCTRRP